MLGLIELRAEESKDFASGLDEIAREGARRMLAEALEAEVADYIARNQERDEHGRARVVRNGKARPRKVTPDPLPARPLHRRLQGGHGRTEGPPGQSRHRFGGDPPPHMVFQR